MARRNLLLDLAPLRRPGDFRTLVGGQAVSVLGTQMAAVAVPYQVYELTRSSLDVGLVSLAQLLPLIGGALLGGAIADAVDRRRMLLAVELLLAACSAGLALNAGRRRPCGRCSPSRRWPPGWPGWTTPGTARSSRAWSAGPSCPRPTPCSRRCSSSAGSPGRGWPGCCWPGPGSGSSTGRTQPASASRSWPCCSSRRSPRHCAIARPARATRPPAGGGAGRAARLLPSLAEGLAYLRGRQALQGAFLIDINATVLGMPRALFPALAATAFGGGAVTVGLLYAAPGAGALIGAVTAGWVGRVRRQGRAVIIAVIVWGLAIAGFGLTALPWAGRPGGATLAAVRPAALIAGLALLAVAGWADVISAVFRTTIVQLSVPAGLLGRLSGLQIAVVTGGPSLGNLEAGAVAAALGATVSVISGGLACVAGALALARLRPGFRDLEATGPEAAGPADGTQAPPAAERPFRAEAEGT